MTGFCYPELMKNKAFSNRSLSRGTEVSLSRCRNWTKLREKKKKRLERKKKEKGKSGGFWCHCFTDEKPKTFPHFQDSKVLLSSSVYTLYVAAQLYARVRCRCLTGSGGCARRFPSVYVPGLCLNRWEAIPLQEKNKIKNLTNGRMTAVKAPLIRLPAPNFMMASSLPAFDWLVNTEQCTEV